MKKLIIVFCLFALSAGLKGQEVTFGTPVCNGTIVFLPVDFTNIYNVGSISCVIDCDSTMYTFLGVIQDSALTAQGFGIGGQGNGHLLFGWYSVGGTGINTNHPFTFILQEHGGCTNLNWKCSPSESMIGDVWANEITCTFIDGYLCPSTVGIPVVNKVDLVKNLRHFNLLGQRVK